MRVAACLTDRPKTDPEQRSKVVVDLPLDEMQDAGSDLQQIAQIVRDDPHDLVRYVLSARR